MEISQVLAQLGLSPKEIQVYLASLELGSAPVQAIAHKTGIERTNVYSILEKLLAKKLLMELEKTGKRCFAPISPDQLVTDLEHKREAVKGVLPELMSIYNVSPDKPRVRYYEGKEAYFKILQETLEMSNSLVYSIGNIDELYSVIPLEWDEDYYIPTRLQKNIQIKILVFARPSTLRLKPTEKKELREIRYLPESAFHEGSKFIYGNKVAIISAHKEMMGLVIESPVISQMEKKYFELMWPLGK